MSGLTSHKKRISTLNDSNTRILIYMAVPCVILLLAFAYVPVYGWIYAFFRYRPGIPLSNSLFMGFDNFTRIFTGRVEIFQVMINTLIFSFLGLLLAPLPMIFAIVMSEFRWRRFHRLVQVTTTFPNFISWVIIYAFCMVMFSVDDGIVNNFLIKTGIITERYNFLADKNNVYFFQTFLSQWKYVGFSAIIYYASIAGIDPEMYDACAVDGANLFHRMWYIKVPFLIPTFLVLFLLQIGSFIDNGFEQFFIFHNAAVHDRIQVLDLYIFKQGMERGDYSLATAAGIGKTIISVLLLFTANLTAKKVLKRPIF